MKKTNLLCIAIALMFVLSLPACNISNANRFNVKNNMKIQIIPTPKKCETDGKGILYDATIVINEEFESEINAFAGYANKLGISFFASEQGAISLKKDAALTAGEYKIKADGNGVVLTASDKTGMNHAFATIIQMMEKDGKTGKVYIPECVIEDKADADHRGVMVDLARVWHDFSYLLKYVDMCYFYKISVLHLHFTDDQSYTLPSDIYPALSTEGRHYTKEQIAQLVTYADERGIELMPEIDVPGHCTSFKEGYPRIFGTSGIICQHEESMQAMRDLFSELCDMFPNSKYIHIGGDEAAIANWTRCSKCKKYIAGKGIDTSIKDTKLLSEQMYANFVSEMADAVFKKGRTPVAWEGFAKEVNDMVSKDIIMMSWENFYQVTPDLLEAGFKILNCSWNPMYIVAPAVSWTQEQVYDWSLYKWKPVHGGSPYISTGLEIEPNDAVLGGQLLAWGDQIAANSPTIEEGVAKEYEMILERIPCLAQNTWNINKQCTYKEFAEIYKIQNVKLSAISNG